MEIQEHEVPFPIDVVEFEGDVLDSAKIKLRELQLAIVGVRVAVIKRSDIKDCLANISATGHEEGEACFTIIRLKATSSSIFRAHFFTNEELLQLRQDMKEASEEYVRVYILYHPENVIVENLINFAGGYIKRGTSLNSLPEGYFCKELKITSSDAVLKVHLIEGVQEWFQS